MFPAYRVHYLFITWFLRSLNLQVRTCTHFHFQFLVHSYWLSGGLKRLSARAKSAKFGIAEVSSLRFAQSVTPRVWLKQVLSTVSDRFFDRREIGGGEHFSLLPQCRLSRQRIRRFCWVSICFCWFIFPLKAPNLIEKCFRVDRSIACAFLGFRRRIVRLSVCVVYRVFRMRSKSRAGLQRVGMRSCSTLQPPVQVEVSWPRTWAFESRGCAKN